MLAYYNIFVYFLYTKKSLLKKIKDVNLLNIERDAWYRFKKTFVISQQDFFRVWSLQKRKIL